MDDDMMDSVQKAQILLLFYCVHYPYILSGFPGTKIAVKGKCVSNTLDNSLSDFISIIYKKLGALLQTAFSNAMF
jgi:hypothetical protein